jgi:phosphoglycolate phosphatase-like HAD superfamily hydrolase
MRRLVALDFDGVICNSMDECMLVSYNAYFNQSHINDIDFSEILAELQSGFKKHRYLVGPAHDFYFLWKSLLSTNTFSSKEIVNTYYKLKTDEAGMELPFGERFYFIRSKLKENHFSQWILLNPIYKQIKSILNDVIDIDNLFIVTAKDTVSVSDLLLANNIEIIKKQIYGREISLDKVKLFRKIIKDTEIEPRGILYIEDNISHLIKVTTMGINGYLATWGYNSPSAPNEALLNDITPLSLNDISSIFINENVVN